VASLAVVEHLHIIEETCWRFIRGL